jgi:crotonobetainyl-CoA:carnitine CoA-transferase CaiB-like acyl-CoA transferase
VLEDPQLVARNVYSPMTHPLIDNPLPAETGPAPYRHIPAARQAPAPLPGEHTVEICRGVLGMNPADIQRLLDDGVLSAPADTV